jgi:carbamoyl-phosphate synthase large subunit
LVNILVTAIGGGGHGEQVVKALSYSMNKRYILFGADSSVDSPQKEMVSKFFILPKANDANYLNELFKILDKFKIDVLIHGCEPELKLFAKHRKEIAEKGVLLLLNSDEVIDLCMDKVATNTFLESNGFSPPRYIEAKNSIDFSKIDWFPVVVKPSLGGGGSANVFIAQSHSELLNLAEYLHLDEDGISFIIQEYVGLAENEFTVGVLSSMEGEFINSIAVKRLMSGQLNIRSKVKNRTSRSDLGKELIVSSGVSQGAVGKFPEVTEQCEAIARKLYSKGPLNIQCRLVDGVVKVFEINPRFSGTSSLRAMVGFNEPDLLIRHHLLHEKIEEKFLFEERTIIRTLKENII